MAIVQDVPRKKPKEEKSEVHSFNSIHLATQHPSESRSTPPSVSGQVSTAVWGARQPPVKKGWFKPNLPQVDCCKSMKCLPFDITDFPAVDCYFTRG
ncbi:hypothetical protein CDAR_368271 [Caerostris darwini]|uniref:Prolactin receptor n=1 Tax=Caerostris darwini TaxID=1538125 RepID=A0AAV4WDY0_9ARAC|nr:hypothetical protein CDAR_368271 [Caerostris darwini]